MKKLLILILAIFNFTGCKAQVNKMFGKRPNILWIMIEDWGYDLSCYGAKGVKTPNIDRLASDGIRFTNSFCTAPVCSPSRSAMMTGFHQDYIGCGQHRTSGPGFEKKALPFGIKPIPHLLEEAGYYTCLIDKKTDCNFTTERPLFKGKDWSEKKEGQPFYAQVSFSGTHRTWQNDTINPLDISAVEVPPFYPDNAFIRRDLATGLEAVQNVDRQIGILLKRLDDEGLSENTLVFFIADNGKCIARGKQFLYDQGMIVPIIARWPGYITPNQVSDNMVMTIDICATILDAAGIKPGYELHGKNLFGKEVAERKYVFAARDKMDQTFDAMRAIRSKEFKLIQNLMPERPYCQFNQYKEATYPDLAMLNFMYLKGELTPGQAKFMAATKPEIELFDLGKDPFELKNLADDPAYYSIKKELLSDLMAWRKSINDPGVSDDFRKGGWPSAYPTRSLEEWTEIVGKWEKWLFSDPKVKAEFPKIKTPDNMIVR
ncbi:MAG: sulfatase [Bacteroidia bacterium]|nr:sulfatase [Bacteroidia bacterium]